MTITDDGVCNTSDSPAAWRTRMTLTLPELGRVDVDLRLAGTALALDCAALEPESVELLRDAGAELVSALEAHAHTVATIEFRRAEA